MDPSPFLQISDLLAAELQRPSVGGLRSLTAIGATSHVQAALALRVSLADWIEAGMRDEMLQKGLETLASCQTLLFTFTDDSTLARFQALEKDSPEKSDSFRNAIRLSQLEIQKVNRLESLPDFANFCLSNRANSTDYWQKVENRLGLSAESAKKQKERIGCMGIVALFLILFWAQSFLE